jgi:hypothetical protein
MEKGDRVMEERDIMLDDQDRIRGEEDRMGGGGEEARRERLRVREIGLIGIWKDWKVGGLAGMEGG